MPDVLSCKEENETRRKRKDSKTTGKCNIAAENGELLNGLSAAPDEKPPVTATRDEFGSQLKIIQINDQVRELQTILRDKETERGDFVFYADRLIRLVVEEGLNQLPYETCTVKTPTGASYEGLAFQRGNCGVSIMRSGEAMEKGLRDCCRSIRIGKILIKFNEESKTPMVYYAKFPPGIDQRKVLLMYPLLTDSGATVITAIKVLLDHGVKQENILLLNVFATPNGVKQLLKNFPSVTILTSEVHSDCPSYFGQRYFGTD
ncbi:uracil phosphoribosyltransferase homolog isoform X1 [Pocillopora verrucosa]|uniref:uracil phosphoribosyltransferase homolog isoform X1 n=1 Tax=Pocillopora damicornis TaxID=46731 RepID=UPI000F5552FE|nr:uracil phosphoribosyltransferase homolog isoform X1 [Pocillopora damicornis]